MVELIFLIPLFIIAGIIYFIYRSISYYLQLKEEQNQLLREILRKMDT